MHQGFLQRIFQPSGGWVYHRRALLNSFRWQTFRVGLESWLLDAVQPGGSLLLVGPSAGYNLEDRFLQRFSSVDALEIDPLSPWLWRLRHKTSVKNWSHENYFFSFSQGERRASPKAFRRLFADFSGHKILFCNLLGQLGYFCALPDDILTAWRSSLQLSTNAWWSFHDLYSLSATKPLLDAWMLQNVLEDRKSIASRLSKASPNIKIVDHLTSAFIPIENPKSYRYWRMDKNSLHIIEATGKIS